MAYLGLPGSTQHVGPRCPSEYGVFLVPRAQTTRAVFLFNHNAIGEGFYTKFAKPKVVSPTAMAKLAIDSGRLEYLVINREICIPNREIGRFSLFYQKSGDLPPNWETGKLCKIDKHTPSTGKLEEA